MVGKYPGRGQREARKAAGCEAWSNLEERKRNSKKTEETAAGSSEQIADRGGMQLWVAAELLEMFKEELSAQALLGLSGLHLSKDSFQNDASD